MTHRLHLLSPAFFLRSCESVKHDRGRARSHKQHVCVPMMLCPPPPPPPSAAAAGLSSLVLAAAVAAAAATALAESGSWNVTPRGAPPLCWPREEGLLRAMQPSGLGGRGDETRARPLLGEPPAVSATGAAAEAAAGA